MPGVAKHFPSASLTTTLLAKVPRAAVLQKRKLRLGKAK